MSRSEPAAVARPSERYRVDAAHAEARRELALTLCACCGAEMPRAGVRGLPVCGMCVLGAVS